MKAITFSQRIEVGKDTEYPGLIYMRYGDHKWFMAPQEAIKFALGVAKAANAAIYEAEDSAYETQKQDRSE